MTDDAELPDWAGPIGLARQLWREFGISADYFTPLDVRRAMLLLDAEAKRERNQVKAANNG